jgi:alpha-1,3/alpha-1,6-mannosyltransferase
VNSGGPLETVVDGETGFLRPPDPEAFATCLAELVESPALATRMGNAGRARVASLFSREAFASRLGAVVERTAQAGVA